jgi:hypothetical protein
MRRATKVFPVDELRQIPEWVDMLSRKELLKRKDKVVCTSLEEKLQENTVHELADLAARFGVVVGKNRSKSRLMSIIATCIAENKVSLTD